MAPGGDWLARKILGGAIVDEMDRRNGAAERAFKSIGKNAQNNQPPSSSRYSESPRESKVRGSNAPQASQYVAQPSRRQSSHHTGVGLRGGDAPLGSHYSGDSPSSYHSSQRRSSQRQSNHPQQASMRDHTERRTSQRHSTRPQGQPSRAADGGPSQDLLVNPYGVKDAAADSNHSINYAVHRSSPTAVGSHRQASGLKSQNIEAKDFYKGQSIAEVAPRSSNHRSVLSATDRHTEDVHPRSSSRHSAAASARNDSRAGDFFTRQMDARGTKYSVEG